MKLPISFEFFPTKTPAGADKLRAVRQQLYAMKPEFCSVTFGAGGSTQEGTLQAVPQTCWKTRRGWVCCERSRVGLALCATRRSATSTF